MVWLVQVMAQSASWRSLEQGEGGWASMRLAQSDGLSSSGSGRATLLPSPSPGGQPVGFQTFSTQKLSHSTSLQIGGSHLL